MGRYRVIGPRRVHETEPGAILERDLPPQQEAALLGVHLEHAPLEEMNDLSPDEPAEDGGLVSAAPVEADAPEPESEE